jgi:nicotinamide-nucleotide amidase
VFPEVQVTVTALGEEAEAVEARAEEVFTQVRERLGEYVITTGGELLEERVGRLLTAAGLRLAVAESCTGGLIGHRLTGVSGSSAYFERGVVVYSNRAKQELLGVAESTLAAHGAVSAPTAGEMAAGIRARAGTALGLAVTGIAGPTGGSADKPVGTVYFGLAADNGVHTWHRLFPGERHQVKAQAAETALVLLMRHLEDHAAVRGA